MQSIHTFRKRALFLDVCILCIEEDPEREITGACDGGEKEPSISTERAYLSTNRAICL